jgi:hypothetical protein
MKGMSREENKGQSDNKMNRKLQTGRVGVGKNLKVKGLALRKNVKIRLEESGGGSGAGVLRGKENGLLSETERDKNDFAFCELH